MQLDSVTPNQAAGSSTMRFSYNQTLILAVAFLAAGQRSLAAITLSNQTAT